MKYNKKWCLILDGNNLIHRSYHAAQNAKWIKNEKDIYIFLKIFISVVKKRNYQKVFFVFDDGRNNFRKELDNSYKSNRPKISDEIIYFMEEVKNLIEKIGLSFTSSKFFEADDLIASFIKKFKEEENFEFHILSQDKDLFQVLQKNVKILRYQSNKMKEFGYENFLAENSFPPENFKYYLSLTGDKVDNVKGVPGIGEKRAKYIVSHFNTIENTFDNIDKICKKIKILIEGKREKIEKNLQIISLTENIPLKNWKFYDFSWEQLKKNKFLIKFLKEKKMYNILSSL